MGRMRAAGTHRACDSTLFLLLLLVYGGGTSASAAGTEERRNWFDTPFAQALNGAAYCPPPEGPLITEQQMRALAHARIERGTSCWLAKKCEDSNAYRRDPEIQDRVIEVLRAQPELARSSIWVTTERHWVTLQGCAESARVRAKILEEVQRVNGVEEVFDQMVVGRQKPRWTVDPAWVRRTR